jgi:spermidine dehydrogenase
MFPDGNASIARLLVRKLIPTVAAGDSMHDIAAAQFDYAQLDQPTNQNRIRLNSTAVNCVHSDNGERLQVTYVNADEAYRIRAKHCILACYNALIPHLCPELPEAQKRQLGLRQQDTTGLLQCAGPQWRCP